MRAGGGAPLPAAARRGGDVQSIEGEHSETKRCRFQAISEPQGSETFHANAGIRAGDQGIRAKFQAPIPCHSKH
jgi:hypothetical protein